VSEQLTPGEVELPVKRTDGDTIEERLTGNAYHNILPARYLRKDADGEVVEDQERLFERVANNVALAEAVYEGRRRDVAVTVEPDQVKPDHPRRGELAGRAFGILSDRHDAPEDLPEDLDRAREHLATDEVELTEDNVSVFAYDTVVPALPDGVREHVESTAGEFRDLMERLAFMPNSPTLMNAGDELQQLSACFVLSPDDDIDDIHEKARQAANIFQSGGGTGYAFWRLRPHGDPVGSTGGIASGPVTFMRTYDQLCETIAQGGARRGAQMAVMRVSHPDVIQFLHAKNKDVSLARTLRLNDPDDYTHTSFADALDEARELIDEDGKVPEHLRNAVEGHLSNFNISVGVTDEFMDAVRAGEEFTFKNPQDGEDHVATQGTKDLYSRFGLGEYVEVGEPLSLPAEEVWNRMIEGAHENGEPGVIFIDRVNDDHSFDVESTPAAESSKHEILSTNPCVTGDTLVSTERGLVPAEELYESGVATDVIVDGRLSDDRVKEASSVYHTGEKDVYRLRTEEGYEVRLTADHRVMTDDGWVEAGDLTPGDTVHVQNHKGEFGQHGSGAEGRVFGWLVGDGHLKHGEGRAVLNFYDQDLSIAEEFEADVNEVVREPIGNGD
jgi:ribonucleoside-diphosphate reductase alpha chain